MQINLPELGRSWACLTFPFVISGRENGAIFGFQSVWALEFLLEGAQALRSEGALPL